MKNLVFILSLLSIEAITSESMAGQSAVTLSAAPYGSGEVILYEPLNCNVAQPMISFSFVEIPAAERMPIVAKIHPSLCRALYVSLIDLEDQHIQFTFYIANQEIMAYMNHDKHYNPEMRLEIRPID